MCTKRTIGLIGLMWLACVMSNVEANPTPNCTVTTFDEALQECAIQLGIPSIRLEKEYKLLLYPADRDSMCLVRCMGVLLRFWNDTTGIREATIRQYYQPAPEDHCYQNRTRICLDALEPSVTDVCERAHRSFLCYHQQYGYLKKDDRYIPKTALEMKQIQQDCLDMFGLSPHRLDQYQDGHFPDDPETQCFVRCVGLKTGLYTDQHGPNVERLYIQCDSCADETVFRERASECIAAQRRHKLSKCTAAYRTLYQCFRDDQLDLYASITTTKVPTTKGPTKTTTNSGPNVIPALSVRETGESHLHLIPPQIQIILKTLYNGKF
ncbi:general odorant-binding protein 45-like [Anopheles funestus]|uniref:general odorant-binding protein 45-like n=1 Tax=Anopheles funestus TaxID=62324 RepID=UPI0020C6FD00|nr:general odorant-binding protein 45-like [Anopheles funestus]